MIDRDLTPAEIEELLHTQCYAHIGFHDETGAISVLPISYVYDDGVFFSFSTKGSKIQAMRNDPKVCLQIEQLHGTQEWKSVQAWGTFSEVGSEDIGQFNVLVEDFWNRVDKNDVIFSAFRDFMEHPKVPMTLYHVTVDKMVGKRGTYSREPMF